MSVEPETPSVSTLALTAYRRRMGRARLVYGAVLAAVCVILLVAVELAWSHGEITHVHQKTVAHPPAAVAAGTPASTQSLLWRSPDATASANPIWNGTILTHDAHTVRGRDATTGAETWHYTRTDRTVCGFVQSVGFAIAFYAHGGDCDEVTALNADTGGRLWVRTLDENGYPSNGPATITVYANTIMVTTHGVIYAFDATSGIDRFQFSQPGCTINGAVIGSAGALISQTCNSPSCSSQKFCTTGPQLLLRDGSSSRNDSDSSNPDRIIWETAKDTDIPASADQLISSVDAPGDHLHVLDSTKGTTLSTLPLAGGGTNGLSHLAAARAELLYLGGHTYSVELTGTDLFWTATTAALPTVTPPGGTSDQPELTTALVLAPTDTGVAIYSGGTGRTVRTILLTGAGPATAAYPLGTGVLLAGTSTAVYR